MHKSPVGLFAEKMASDYLESKGYDILDRNWSRKWGELDIVATKNGTVVFCEVKAGSGGTRGFEPELHANREKMKKVYRTARTWLAYRKYPEDQPWQIDILAVTFNKTDRTAALKHYRNVEI